MDVMNQMFKAAQEILSSATAKSFVWLRGRSGRETTIDKIVPVLFGIFFLAMGILDY
jgi:hypothetical protein